MGTIYVKPGGSGVDLDAVTAEAGDVLAGKTFVDANENEVSGTLALSGNAQTAHVLAGETFYAADAKTKLTGTMANNSTTTSNGNVPGISESFPNVPTREGENLQMTTSTDGVQRINIGVPGGYWPGASLSYVNCTAKDVANALGVQTVVNFKVAFSGDKLVGSWGMPIKGPLTKVRVQYRMDGKYPTGAEDGTTIFDSWDMNQKTATGFSIVPPGGYGTYHIRAWCEVHYTNPDMWVSKQIWEGVVDAAPALNTNPDWAINYTGTSSDSPLLTNAYFNFTYGGQQYDTGSFSYSPAISEGGAVPTVSKTFYSNITSKTANGFRLILKGGTDFQRARPVNKTAYVYIWKADDTSKYMRLAYKDMVWSSNSSDITHSIQGIPSSTDIYISDTSFFLTDSIKSNKVAMCMRVNP